MSMLTVSADGRGFVRDGKPFLYAADTAWSAPTNATMDEWRSYLRIRVSQGFSAIQINLLPQWDRSRPASDTGFGLAAVPFKRQGGRSDGPWDYASPNEAYFARVDAFVGEVRDQGLVPALVIFWADYVAGNWCSRRNPGHEIPAAERDGLAAYLAGRYARFDPVYIVSGDPDLDSAEAAGFYLDALAAVKKAAPACLTCLHLCGNYSAIPQVILDSPNLDFYMYQSGHQAVQEHLRILAASYRSLKRRPIVNGEICYEGMGRVERPERFGPWDVRRAIWLSLLSGANAGFGYGAYGVWNWHRSGDESVWLDIFGPSPDFQQGLALPEATKTGLVAEIWRSLGLHEIEPVAPVPGEGEGVAFARLGGGRGWVAYADGPRLFAFPSEAEKGRQQPTRVRVFDFEAGTVSVPRMGVRADGGRYVDCGTCRRDLLVIMEKE